MSKTQTATAKFIKLSRFEGNPDLEMLIKSHHNEFILLTIIALRARRVAEKCPMTGLLQNQAFIGDYSNFGMTRQKYRTSKSNLQKWGYITTEATNKGTTATLLDTKVYDINSEATNHQDNQQLTTEVTSKQPATNHKEECKNEKNAKNGRIDTPSQSSVGKQEKKDSSNQKQKASDHWSEEKCAALELWLQYKKEKRQSYKPTGLKTLIKRFDGWEDMRFIEAVDYSMAIGYSGIYEEKQQSATTRDTFEWS